MNNEQHPSAAEEEDVKKEEKLNENVDEEHEKSEVGDEEGSEEEEKEEMGGVLPPSTPIFYRVLKNILTQLDKKFGKDIPRIAKTYDFVDALGSAELLGVMTEWHAECQIVAMELETRDETLFLNGQTSEGKPLPKLHALVGLQDVWSHAKLTEKSKEYLWEYLDQLAELAAQGIEEMKKYELALRKEKEEKEKAEAEEEEEDDEEEDEKEGANEPEEEEQAEEKKEAADPDIAPPDDLQDVKNAETRKNIQKGLEQIGGSGLQLPENMMKKVTDLALEYHNGIENKSKSPSDVNMGGIIKDLMNVMTGEDVMDLAKNFSGNLGNLGNLFNAMNQGADANAANRNASNKKKKQKKNSRRPPRARKNGGRVNNKKRKGKRQP